MLEYENELKLEGIRLESFMNQYYNTLMKEAEKIITKNKEEYNKYIKDQLQLDVESAKGEVYYIISYLTIIIFQIALKSQQYIQSNKDEYQHIIKQYKEALKSYNEGLLLQAGITLNEEWYNKGNNLKEQWNERIEEFHKIQRNV